MQSGIVLIKQVSTISNFERKLVIEIVMKCEKRSLTWPPLNYVCQMPASSLGLSILYWRRSHQTCSSAIKSSYTSTFVALVVQPILRNTCFTSERKCEKGKSIREARAQTFFYRT